MSSKNQCTIGDLISCSGIGLHTGNKTAVTFKPAPVDTGIRFIRVDLEGSPSILADVDFVLEVSQKTTIGTAEFKIHTVEHVLAAIAGLGIDNLYVELDSDELPAADGSARPFLEQFKAAQIVEQAKSKATYVIDTPLSYTDGDKIIFATPYDGFKISYTIDFPNPLVGVRFISLDIDPTVFEQEIAAARTFALINEVELLRSRGLIKGGSLENAVVVGDGKILNSEPLRFPDEFVRHKVLDLIGDLALLGRPIKGHIYASKGGHSTHVGLAKCLREHFNVKSKPPVHWDISAIRGILPHRYPFLLVDRVLHVEPGKRIVAIKNVTINEPFFVGHFPNRPVMPGVLQLEAMAQVGALLMLDMIDRPEDKLIYLTGLDNVRFRKPVVPGDQIRFELETIRIRSRFTKMLGRGYVDNDVVVEAELSAALLDHALK